MNNIKIIQKAFYHNFSSRYELVFPNVFFGPGKGNEFDLLGVRKSGFIDEIEIKVTHSDFLADFNKLSWTQTGVKKWGSREIPLWEKQNKHQLLMDGKQPPNYFSFLLPVELVDKCTVPDYAGIYTYVIGQKSKIFISEVRSAPRLHTRKISMNDKYMLSRKFVFRYWDTFN